MIESICTNKEQKVYINLLSLKQNKKINLLLTIFSHLIQINCIDFDSTKLIYYFHQRKLGHKLESFNYELDLKVDTWIIQIKLNHVVHLINTLYFYFYK